MICGSPRNLNHQIWISFELFVDFTSLQKKKKKRERGCTLIQRTRRKIAVGRPSGSAARVAGATSKAYSDTTPSRTGGGSDLDPCPLKRGRPTRQWLRPCAKPLTGGARWASWRRPQPPARSRGGEAGGRRRRLPALPATVSGDPATGVLGETCRIREATLQAPASSERSGPSPAAEDGIGHCRLRAQGRPGEEWRRWGASWWW